MSKQLYNFDYRAATLADIPALKLLALDAYGSHAPHLTPENLTTLQNAVSVDAMWEDLIKKSASFLCIHDSDIVGMAFLVPSGNPWDIYPANWSYLRMVGVAPDFMRNGIARKLTIQCIEAARGMGEHTIALHTSEIMEAARKLYESLGFCMRYEIPNRFGLRYWVYTLQL